MEPVPTPTVPTQQTKDLSQLTKDEIDLVRKTMDKLSWTLFNSDATGSKDNLLRINFENLFLIEGFNYFGTGGLKTYFESKEMVLDKIGTIRVIEHRLDRPVKDSSSDASPLYPDDARRNKVDYNGSLLVKIEITWDQQKTGMTGGTYVSEFFTIGKIPIMVGSAFCNLSYLKTEKELAAVNECQTDAMGYFIMNGNEKNLIAQNYRKTDDPIVIPSKVGAASQPVRTACDIKSKGSDASIRMHKIFIMDKSDNSVLHGDRRIYIQMSFIERSPAYIKSKTIAGANVMTIFRLGIIYAHILNPFDPDGSYIFADMETSAGIYKAGFRQQSTYPEARQFFEMYVKDYAGEKLWKLSQNYINDTLNEASLEEDEQLFWENTVMLKSKDPKDTALAILAESVLKEFGTQFLPHMSKIPFQAQIREMTRLKKAFRDSVRTMHEVKRFDASNEQINASVVLLGELHKLDPNSADSKLWSDRLMNERGIYINDEFHAVYNLYSTMISDMSARLKMICYMIVKVLIVELGIDVYDDKDSLANQMYEHAGLLMISRFASMFRDIESKLKSETSTDGNYIKGLLGKYGDDIITKGFSNNFRTGDWNSRKAEKARHGVTDMMPSSVNVARKSYLRRISANSGSKSKNPASRALTGLQLGAICISETPEGTQCGNVEHLALAAFLTNESFDSQTLAYRLIQMKTGGGQAMNNVLSSDAVFKQTRYISELRKTEPTNRKETSLFLNGRPIGWVNGLEFRRVLIEMRRAGSIHPHTGIHYTQKQTRIGIVSQLKITTGPGRIVQPLMIAENAQMTVNILWALSSSDIEDRYKTFDQLVYNGYVEFVDSAELEFLDLAPSVDVYLNAVKDGLHDRFDHILLNPAFIMGAAANIMPFAANNPVVRNSYFTQMVKQPIVTPMATAGDRVYTAMYSLSDVQKPLVTTAGYNNLFTEDHFGRNLNILITPNKFGEEDGIVVNQRFIDMGGLASTKYSTFPVEIADTEELDFGEHFMESQRDNDPDRYGRGIIKVRRRVLKTDMAGNKYFAEEPVIVKPDDILARKISKGTDMKRTYTDVTFDSIRTGIVDRIIWSKKIGKSSRMVYIVIRFPDTIWIGDKLASRYSQKGLTASVMADVDMPFDAETGERADLIINPQAFPSRMTVGMLNEMLVGSAHVMPDTKKNVHYVYTVQEMDIYAPLERLFVVEESSWKDFVDAGGKYTKQASVKVGLLSEIDFDQMGLSETQKQKSATSISFDPRGKYIMIPSETISEQDSMSFLRENDVMETVQGYEQGLWAIKYFFTDPNQASNSNTTRYIALGTKESLEPIQKVTHRMKFVTRYFTVDEADIKFIDNSRTSPILFDLEKDEDDQYIHFMTGIRVSKLPEDVRTIYLKGNSYTPVPDQHIADYKPGFFTKHNLRRMDIDFRIPNNMLDLGLVYLKEDPNVAQPVILPENTRYSELEKEETVVMIKSDRPEDAGKLIDITLSGVWSRIYGSMSSIPRENVIMLPTKARDIYVTRRNRIMELREATIFKGGIDIRDAMRELELMGYKEDASRKFYNGKTGELMPGMVVSGWSYYMALRHKVKDKAQARGEGIMDPRHGQPNQGKTKEGGLRFNYADAVESIKSGANQFVNDRLLDATGKKNVFVCTTCNEICYRESKGAIICPMCRSDTEAIKISIPYVFMVMRNLLMGAGVRLAIKPTADE